MLRSGQTSNEYFDKYLFESQPALLLRVAQAMVPRLPTDTQLLGGLERELPYPLSRVVDDMREALQRRTFHDRIVARIDTNPPEPRRPTPDVR